MNSHRPLLDDHWRGPMGDWWLCGTDDDIGVTERLISKDPGAWTLVSRSVEVTDELLAALDEAVMHLNLTAAETESNDIAASIEAKTNILAALHRRLAS